MARSSARRSCVRRIPLRPCARSSRPVRVPDDPANVRATPVRQDLRRHRCSRRPRRGPRRGRCDRAQRRPGHAPRTIPRGGRRPGPDRPSRRNGDRRPAIVAITADADPEHLAAVITGIDPDVVQLAGAKPSRRRERSGGGPGRSSRSRHRTATSPTSPAPRPTSCRARGHSSTPGSTRVLLDAAGGPHPGGTGTPRLGTPRRRGRP